MSNNCILWFRKDLRLDDNKALVKAAQYQNIFPIFIFDNSLHEYAKIGGASHWWMEKALISLNNHLNKNLNIFDGNSLKIIVELCKEHNIKNVFLNRCYEPDRIIADKKIKKVLKDKEINVQSFNSSLLWEPWKIKNRSGSFYKVFTPFFKKGCLEAEEPRYPINAPSKTNFLKINSSQKRYKFQFNRDTKKWYSKFENIWNVSEHEANKIFKKFLIKGIRDYKEGRNFPNKKNVSRISGYLHWGQISPFRIWHDVKNSILDDNKNTFLSELGWREFSYNLLYHYPNINNKNLKQQFDNLKWDNNKKNLVLWQLGKTGYPIVDAGMRELWQTGYMHNRLRMITASFLVKNLLIHWKYGERWFWDCLIDADLANNSASWQWVAGTGSDAAPFFRIFNPITQGQKFDKEASYIRTYLPELSKLPNKYIFTPWLTDKSILDKINLKLGRDYPFPIIDYTYSRKRALEAFKNI